MAINWESKPLSDLCSYINRGAAPTYVDSGGILVLNQKCVRDQRVSFAEARRTDNIRKPIAPERLLQRYDILVNSTGVGTLGRVAQVTHLPEPCSVDSHLTIVRASPPAVHPRYLGFVLRYFQPEIEALAEGSTGQTELARTRLALFNIPLPPKEYQVAIANILGTMDDKIELTLNMGESVDGMARALFRSWFLDFDPVRAKLDRCESKLPKPIADLFPDSFDNSVLGEVPTGWQLLPLPEAIDVNPLRSLRKGELAPYLDMANMPIRGHCPDVVAERAYGSGMRFTNGDTLVARITPCLENGKTGFVDFLAPQQVGWGSTEYIILRSKRPLPDEYAYCLARSTEFREFCIRSMTGTSGRQRVPAEALDHFVVVVPSEAVAKKFGQMVEPLLQKAKSLAEESRLLAATRDALLPRLLRGELTLSSAERFLGGLV